MTVHALVFLVATTALGSTAAGCGGRPTPSVARLEVTTSPTTRPSGEAASPQGPSPAKWANCMNLYGVSAAAGPGGHGFLLTGNVDPGSPRFQAAQRACAKYQPGGGPPKLTPAQQALRAQGLAVLASCMRSHGVASFPDPNGQGELPFGSLSRLNFDSPVFKTAYKACWPLFPKVGPQLQIGP